MAKYSNDGSLVQFKGTDMPPITIAIARDREWAKIMVDHLNNSFTKASPQPTEEKVSPVVLTQLK